MPNAIATPSRIEASMLSALGSPLEVARRWPRDRRLIMLHSGRMHPRWARWSILASPVATYGFVNGRSQWRGNPPPGAAKLKLTHDPLTDLDAIVNATAARSHLNLPFTGGWLGYLSYDLGRVIEPKATHAPQESNWPLIELAYCPNALVFDSLHQQWHAIGDIDEALALVNGNAELIEEAFELGPILPAIAAEQYMQMVERTIEYIRAGDIFQANIAQRFSAEFSGSPRALALAALERPQPWYGAYLELDEDSDLKCEISNLKFEISNLRSEIPRRALISLSPELFLQIDPPGGRSQTITTRPIKGTRPAACDPAILRNSTKDAAELHMIVDLMRNDLGRVCQFGSMQVIEPRAIESHPTVHHGVAEIIGTLREDTSIGDILRATFPGGSVTGAPKIRAMQIIDELETGAIGPRGPYCGSIGFISNNGAITLNIAIRTIEFESCPQSRGMAMPRRWSHVVQYSAGAGIVADSSPRGEYAETLDKAAVLQALI